MNTKFFFEMTENELEQVDLVKFTGLNIGDRITHANAGKHGGNGSIISSQLGTIVGHNNEGLTAAGSLCVSVKVLWDDGRQYTMLYNLAKKAV